MNMKKIASFALAGAMTLSLMACSAQNSGDASKNTSSPSSQSSEETQNNEIPEFADGKNAIVGLVTSGSYNVLGDDGRCSMIGREIGFTNIGVDASIDTSAHGNEASFEFIVEKAPEYIFILDRDAAIGTNGAKLAQEIMENALDLMLQDLEGELLN